MNPILNILSDVLFIVLLSWCGYTDMRSRAVSNIAIFLLLCLGLSHATLMLLTGNTWLQYPAGLLLSTPFFIAWLKNGMGAGDVKLIAAVPMYLGFLNMLIAFTLMVPVLVVQIAWSCFKHKTLKCRIPLAPMIGVGGTGAVLLGYLIRLIYS
jgi:prepilin peptidase CpaA